MYKLGNIRKLENSSGILMLAESEFVVGHVCVCVSYVCLHVLVCVCVYVCTCLSQCACVCMCIACMFESVCMCVHMCMCVHVSAHI